MFKSRLFSKAYYYAQHASVSRVTHRFIAACFCLVFSSNVFAATATAGGTWGPLYTLVHGWFTGTPADLVALLLFGTGLGIGAVRHSAGFFITGIVLAALVRVGPEIYMSMTGAVL